MTRQLAIFSAFSLLVAACGTEDELLEEADGAGDELVDPEKADVVSPITIAGGITLEDSLVAQLPVVPKYVGYVVLAPKGADLKIAAAGGTLATKVTLYGPRAANGSFGRAVSSGLGELRATIPADGAYLAVPQPRYVGKSGPATVSVACFGSNCRGYCNATPPSLVKRSWVHSTLSPLSASNGDANHRSYDRVAKPGTKPSVTARFTYGTIDKDLEDEDVDLWVRTCPGWTKVGTARTDDDGYATVTLTSALPAGDYKLVWMVAGDGSTADGALSVWERGREIFVSDIDGTLTTNDAQIFKQIFLGSDPAQYKDAETMLWIVRRQGYRVQYMSGRPESLGRSTKAWLVKHKMPPGASRLTDETLEALPTESGVGDFKTRMLNDLTSTFGVTLSGGFGNATTDISAYQAAGIANNRLFIIGPHAGERGSTPVASYTGLLNVVRAFPFAKIP